MTSNETTGTPYQGRNVDRLAEAEQANGYDSAHGWAGYKQWLAIGRVVRKGEHGTPCLTVVTIGGDAEGNGGTRKPRGFRVFHFDQTTALAEVTAPAETGHAPDIDLLAGA